MGNNFSQELRAHGIAAPTRDTLTHSSIQRTKVFGQNTTDLYVYRPSNCRVRCKSTGTNTGESVYATSCLYRRKVYAESLPKLKQTAKHRSSSTPKHPLCSAPSTQSIQSERCMPNFSVSSARNSALRPVKEPPLLGPFNQQWNGNNWTGFGSDNSQDSCVSLTDFNSAVSTIAKPLPKLLSVHQLMDKLDCELSKSKALLKKTVDGLTDTDQLVSRNTSEQRELIRKTEESVCNTQTLLAKVHQHIANTHEFCNMLHRVDESLQLFSKAAYSVATWEQVKQEDTSRLPE